MGMSIFKTRCASCGNGRSNRTQGGLRPREYSGCGRREATRAPYRDIVSAAVHESAFGISRQFAVTQHFGSLSERSHTLATNGTLTAIKLTGLPPCDLDTLWSSLSAAEHAQAVSSYLIG